MSDVIGRGILEIGGDSTQFDAAMSQAERTAQKFERTAAGSAAKVGDAFQQSGRKTGEAAGQMDVATRRFLTSLERESQQVGRTRAEYLEMRAAQLGAADAASAAITRIREAEAKARQATGTSAAQTAAAMRGLPAQITDVVTSLQGGQAPLTVLLQQGGQIKDQFGGVKAALQGVASVFTPFNIAVGAGAAAVGGLAYAAAEGFEQVRRFRQMQQETGNAVGLTIDGYNAAARAVRNYSGGTIGASREMLEALVATGKFGGAALTSISAAAVTLQSVTGKTTEEITSAFAGMRNGVSTWAADANRSYNFVSAAQVKHLQELESQGRFEEAARYAADRLTTVLKERAPQLGIIEQALKAGSKAWSGWWDSALDIGRPVTLTDKLDDVNKRLASARQFGIGGGRRASTQAGIVAGIEGERGAVNRSLMNDAEAAAEARVKFLENQQAIYEASRDFQARLNAVQDAGLQLRLTRQTIAAEQERQALAESYSLGVLSLQGFAEAKYVIERKALQDQAAVVDAQIALEKRLKPSGSPEQVADQRVTQEARLLELQKQRLPIQAALADLETRRRRGELVPEKIIDRYTVPTDALRKIERGQAEPATPAGASVAALRAAEELVASNKATNIALIRDDRARGTAQIAAEEEQLRKRLELTTLTAEQQRRVSEELATWRVLREQQLTEQLKPEWQRMLDGWSDTNRLMQTSWDSTVLSSLRAGEDAWVQFATTGKLNFRSLLNTIIAEQARLKFREAASGSSGFFGALLSGLGLLTGGASGSLTGATGFGDYNEVAAIAAGRANGGSVNSYGLHPVVERGEPEVLRNRKGTYLINGSDGGQVMPLRRIDNLAPASGGNGGGGMRDIKVTVVNNGTPMQVTGQRQLSDDELLIIMDDRAATATRRAVATVRSEIRDPNGSIGRDISSRFRVQRNVA